MRGAAKLGGCEIVVLLGKERQDAVALGGSNRLVERLWLRCKAAGFARSAADYGWSGDVEFAEVTHGGDVGGIEA